ncbi:MAG: cytochrome c biogenesis protein ResB [Kiritimatiellaeota bacterium]|nr:cytochrome c biogenesis protein ResB [Kiritimatiellota bacterium]
MSRWLQKLLGLSVAMWLCLLFAGGAVVLAFFGAEVSGALMGCTPHQRETLVVPMFNVTYHIGEMAWITTILCQRVTLVLAIGLVVSGIRAIRRTRYDSVLIHIGCACVMGGWLIGQHAVRTTSEDRPVTGAMALIDGDTMDTLWGGATLNEYLGKLPFTVHLDTFTVAFYKGGLPREYRSRITILEPGKAPRTEDVLVNHPARAHGYHIYQMSWGESTDHYGRPVTYTVLQFIRDPGLYVVYTGFAALFLGTIWFAARVFKGGVGMEGECPRKPNGGEGRP